MEEAKKQWGKVTDFEGQPHIVEVLAFDRVQGKSKFLDKYGFSNFFTYREQDVEKTLDNSSYAFMKEFQKSGLHSGDTAMVLTVAFTDPASQQKYRWWIFQKLEKQELPTIQIDDSGPM